MIFKNVTFYNEVFQKDVADIQVENGRITAIGVLEQEGRDMQGYTLLPGFVDIHIHGRGGGDFSDGTVSSMDRISASRTYLGDAYDNHQPLEYFLKSKPKLWFVHPQTKKELEGLLRILSDKGEDKALWYIKNVYLKKGKK